MSSGGGKEDGSMGKVDGSDKVNGETSKAMSKLRAGEKVGRVGLNIDQT